MKFLLKLEIWWISGEWPDDDALAQILFERKRRRWLRAASRHN
jgi:hypothetical protein